MMGCQFHSLNTRILVYKRTHAAANRVSTSRLSISPSFGVLKATSVNSNLNEGRLDSTAPRKQTQIPKSDGYNVEFATLGGCKLGISRYPDFEYNAQGGRGSGPAAKLSEDINLSDEFDVDFDVRTLYIPPLSSATTKFLGLPLPSFLKIDIVPEAFQGKIDRGSGKVEMKFRARFWFSIGSIYKAPSLLVDTVLTSEESKGESRGGSGQRLDKDGMCRLVGVARVDPINDIFMDTFLSLPTECLASLNAKISF